MWRKGGRKRLAANIYWRKNAALDLRTEREREWRGREHPHPGASDADDGQIGSPHASVAFPREQNRWKDGHTRTDANAGANESDTRVRAPPAPPLLRLLWNSHECVAASAAAVFAVALLRLQSDSAAVTRKTER